MKWFYTAFPFLFFLLTSTALAGIQDDIEGGNKVGLDEIITHSRQLPTSLKRLYNNNINVHREIKDDEKNSIDSWN